MYEKPGANVRVQAPAETLVVHSKRPVALRRSSGSPRLSHYSRGEDSSFLDLVEERRIGAEPSVRIMDLEPGTYFWRVMSINKDGFEGLPTGGSYFIYVRPKP